ncbi:MAG: hypothetical protein AAB624_01285 [Patescibacteria group bacterium]
MDKKVVYIGASIFGAIGSFLGSLLDGGNFFGVWGILGGLAGGLLGVFIAYKSQQ